MGAEVVLCYKRDQNSFSLEFSIRNDLLLSAFIEGKFTEYKGTYSGETLLGCSEQTESYL